MHSVHTGLALCLEQLREDHPVVLLPVHFLFLRPFVLAKLLHLNDSRGKEREWTAAPTRSRVRAEWQERENRSHFSTKGKRARQQTPKLLAILYLAYDSTMIMRPFLIASRPRRDKNECSAMQIRFYASNYLECWRWITRGASKFIFTMPLRKNYFAILEK